MVAPFFLILKEESPDSLYSEFKGTKQFHSLSSQFIKIIINIKRSEIKIKHLNEISDFLPHVACRIICKLWGMKYGVICLHHIYNCNEKLFIMNTTLKTIAWFFFEIHFVLFLIAEGIVYW